MKARLSTLLSAILKGQRIGVAVEVSVPDNPVNGDYSTNVAMKLFGSDKRPFEKTQGKQAISKKLKTPMEVALWVVDKLKAQISNVKSKKQYQNIYQKDQKGSQKVTENNILQAIDRVEVAPPGFINFFLTEAKLISQINQVLRDKEVYGTSRTKEGEGIMVEYGDPNTHKAFHIGHLRNISIGESVARLLEAVGADVIHASYQGDVGMHIAKCLYALLRIDHISNQIAEIRESDVKSKIDFLGKAYAAGSGKYEENDEVKKEVGEINKKIYAKDLEVYTLYQESRQWSLDYFEGIYKRVGTQYKRNYFESEVYETGKHNVLEGFKKGIFVESDGAIIFPGEKFGLHNRVFITKEGNATYEGKDMGLGPLQYHDLAEWTKQPTLIIRVVGPEQAGYFQVVFEAQSQLFSELRDKFYHLIAGWVKLKQGKMSSRSGNVVLGEWLLDEAKQSIYKILEKSDTSQEEKDTIAEKAAVAAVKYSFLRVSTESEIAFDLAESVNFQGDSGPYLQYTYARCKSVLRRGGVGQISLMSHISQTKLNSEERSICRLIGYFPDVVAQAAADLAPSTLCTYLFHLAQAFNLFYAKHSILGGEGIGYRVEGIGEKQKSKTLNPKPQTLNPANFRLALTAATAQVMSTGLYLLGIEVLEQM